MSCWSKRIHCRCLDCEHRQALRRKPSWYVRPPQCNVCGKRRWYIDKWMMRRDTSPRTGSGCMCGGYHFIHRKGSKFCYENANAEAHYIERGGEVRTPITGRYARMVDGRKVWYEYAYTAVRPDTPIPSNVIELANQRAAVLKNPHLQVRKKHDI